MHAVSCNTAIAASTSILLTFRALLHIQTQSRHPQDDARVANATALRLSLALPQVQLVKNRDCLQLVRGIMQAAGYALRISCATPMLSSALGMAGIGFSSVLAGEASRRFGARLTGKRPHRSAQAIARDVALDALLGMSLYKVPACASDTFQCLPHCCDC